MTSSHLQSHPDRSGINIGRVAGDACGSGSSWAVEGEVRWFAIRTLPFSEMRAIGNLERQGYRIFCPRTYKSIHHARKVSKVMRPIFPNYLFVELDVERDQWRRINSTRGVASLIMYGDRPQAVQRGIIEALLQHVRSDGTLDLANPFKNGQTVRIESGPLADLFGKFERCEPDGRIRILVDLLGRVISVVLNKEALITAA